MDAPSDTSAGTAKTEKNVLLVEDDFVFRQLLARCLKDLNYTVREAENGLIAQTIFDLTPSKFDLIISDIRMPELDGIGLLKHIRSRSLVPLILMTGFSEILEVQDAYDLGANEFLPKPFRTDTLEHAITNCLTKKDTREKNEPKDESAQYCQIHIDEFVSSSHLHSDVYVRLHGKKYIKVAHKGANVPVERLKTYKERNVEYLYVSVEDFANYVNFNIQVARASSKVKSLDQNKRLRLLKHTLTVISEKCFVMGMDQKLIEPATEIVADTLKVATEDSQIFDLLEEMKGQSDRLYAHSTMVTLLACLISKQNGWTSRSTLFKVSLGALMHDIGKRELPPSILIKKRSALTSDEIKLLESHPVRGRDILLSIRSLPEEISQIAFQHHETNAGTGYPLKIRTHDIHPIAKLIHVVDKFCNLVMPMSDSVESLTPEAALETVISLYSGELDSIFLKRLSELVKEASGRRQVA